MIRTPKYLVITASFMVALLFCGQGLIAVAADPPPTSIPPAQTTQPNQPVVTQTSTFGRGQLDANQDCSVITRGWLCNQGDLYGVINQISNYVITIFGSVAVLLILWYIITIIASSGNPEQISNAKKHLMLVAVSLGLLIIAYAVIQLVGIF